MSAQPRGHSGQFVASRQVGVTLALAEKWRPTLYLDFGKILPSVQSPSAGISAEAAYGDRHVSWDRSQGTGSEPSLPLMLRKISNKCLPFCVSVSV